jgi:hypothetical protein
MCSLVVSNVCSGSLTFGEFNKLVGIFTQFCDEQGKEVCQPIQKMGSTLMQTWRVADDTRVILLVVTQNAVMVPAEDDRGVVKLAAGDVVSFKTAHVIQPTLNATRMVDA